MMSQADGKRYGGIHPLTLGKSAGSFASTFDMRTLESGFQSVVVLRAAKMVSGHAQLAEKTG
jgi:hypothetical protein